MIITTTAIDDGIQISFHYFSPSSFDWFHFALAAIKSISTNNEYSTLVSKGKCLSAVSIGTRQMVSNSVSLRSRDLEYSHSPLCLSTESLKRYFTQFGNVTHCLVMRDSQTGRSRGFAFLTFEDPKAVNSVMVREHFLDGKIVRPLGLPYTRFPD